MIKKRVMVIVLVSLLVVSLVSASWFGDFLGKISGKTISSDAQLKYRTSSDGGLTWTAPANSDGIAELIPDAIYYNSRDRKLYVFCIINVFHYNSISLLCIFLS